MNYKIKKMLPDSYRLLLISGLLLLVSGCATTTPENPDPYESFNRSVFKFNTAIDNAVIKPAAKGYAYVTPSPVRKGITNFFSNINDFSVVVNDLLQGKFSQAMHDSGRFILNTTVGIGGLFDVATLSGLPKHNEDFGQTFGVWGFKPGAYLMLPFLGPSDVRDGIGFVGNAYVTPLTAFNTSSETQWVLTGLNLLNRRANFLPQEKLLDAAAIDKYSYLRNLYLQNRLNLVYDGNPPQTKQDKEDDELLFGNDSD